LFNCPHFTSYKWQISFKPPAAISPPTSPNTSAQVADFNLSRGADSQGLSTVVVQNPRWLAPERLAGGAGGLPSDVWAFGTVSEGDDMQAWVPFSAAAGHCSWWRRCGAGCLAAQLLCCLRTVLLATAYRLNLHRRPLTATGAVGAADVAPPARRPERVPGARQALPGIHAFPCPHCPPCSPLPSAQAPLLPCPSPRPLMRCSALPASPPRRSYIPSKRQPVGQAWLCHRLMCCPRGRWLR